MEYFYKVKLTNDKELKVREMNLEEYKNLQKICIEDDISIFQDYIKTIFNNLVLDEFNFDELNIIDIYVLMLSIRKYSVSDEKGFRTRKEGKDCLVDISLDGLIDKVISIVDDNSIKEVELDDFVADSVIVDILKSGGGIRAFKKEGQIIDDFGENINDLLPIHVKTQIEGSIGDIKNQYRIKLFELVDKNDNQMDITFELEESFIYNFLKVICKDDLKSLYSNLYNVKKAIGIGFDEHEHITLSEFEMYINLFNKDQQKEREEQEQGSNNFMPNVNM